MKMIFDELDRRIIRAYYYCNPEPNWWTKPFIVQRYERLKKRMNKRY